MGTTTNTIQRDNLAAGQLFTITDWAEDYALDCNTDAVAAANNVLGTLIKVLIEKGIISGSVTTAA